MRDRRSSSNPCSPAERYSAEKATLQLAYANFPFGHPVILYISILRVLFIKYASLLLQALTVQIEESFLYAITDVFEGVSWQTETEE